MTCPAGGMDDDQVTEATAVYGRIIASIDEPVIAQLSAALQDAADALGRDRGRRNETIAERIMALRQERDDLQRRLDEALRGEAS